MLEVDIDGLGLTRPHNLSGRVSRFDGQIIECDGFPATIGTLCEVDTQVGGCVNAEVIGFRQNYNILSVHAPIKYCNFDEIQLPQHLHNRQLGYQPRTKYQ